MMSIPTKEYYYIPDSNKEMLTRKTGPPMRTATNIIISTEPFFEILSLTTSVFGNDQVAPAKNWVCLMKKRNF